MTTAAPQQKQFLLKDVLFQSEKTFFSYSSESLEPQLYKVEFPPHHRGTVGKKMALNCSNCCCGDFLSPESRRWNKFSAQEQYNQGGNGIGKHGFFRHGSGTVLAVKMSIGWSTLHFCPDGNISTTDTAWTATIL